MNRHARRATWAAGIGAVAEESGGMMDLSVIRPVDAPELFAAAMAGDRGAARLSRAVVDQIHRVAAAGNGPGAALCGCCENRLALVPYAVVIATPHRDDPAGGIGLGICADCATEPEPIGAKAIEALRRIFPDGRAVRLQGHVAGRA